MEFFKKKRVLFSSNDQEVKLLIELVRRHPIIYNSRNNLAFNRRFLVLNAWKNIARLLDNRYNYEECRAKWRILRDTYVKYRRQKLMGRLSEWRFAKDMNFLANFQQPWLYKRQKIVSKDNDAVPMLMGGASIHMEHEYGMRELPAAINNNNNNSQFLGYDSQHACYNHNNESNKISNGLCLDNSSMSTTSSFAVDLDKYDSIIFCDNALDGFNQMETNSVIADAELPVIPENTQGIGLDLYLNYLKERMLRLPYNKIINLQSDLITCVTRYETPNFDDDSYQ